MSNEDATYEAIPKRPVHVTQKNVDQFVPIAPRVENRAGDTRYVIVSIGEIENFRNQLATCRHHSPMVLEIHDKFCSFVDKLQRQHRSQDL